MPRFFSNHSDYVPGSITWRDKPPRGNDDSLERKDWERSARDHFIKMGQEEGMNEDQLTVIRGAFEPYIMHDNSRFDEHGNASSYYVHDLYDVLHKNLYPMQILVQFDASFMLKVFELKKLISTGTVDLKSILGVHTHLKNAGFSNNELEIILEIPDTIKGLVTGDLTIDDLITQANFLRQGGFSNPMTRSEIAKMPQEREMESWITPDGIPSFGFRSFPGEREGLMWELIMDFDCLMAVKEGCCEVSELLSQELSVSYIIKHHFYVGEEQKTPIQAIREGRLTLDQVKNTRASQLEEVYLENKNSPPSNTL